MWLTLLGCGLKPQPALAQAVSRPATSAASMAACSQVEDDRERLACYDSFARPRAARDPGSILLLSASPPADPSPGPTARPLRPPHPIRAELGFSAAIGNYAGASKLSGDGTLEVDSATGGEGVGLTAETWFDDWPRKNLSVGLGYLQINNRGVIDATLPHGVLILTDPVEARLAVAAQADLAMFDLAYRPSGFGLLRPVAGLGLGVGYATGVVDTMVSNPFIGSSNSRSRSGSPFPALEAFTGVEADLGRSAYVSLIPRLLIVSAHPLAINQRYTDFMLNATIGYRFH